MVLSETIGYITVFALPIIFTAFSLSITKGVWAIVLKFIAGLFWVVLSLAFFFYMGAGGFLMILSLPFACIGLIFWVMIIRDILSDKKRAIWDFD